MKITVIVLSLITAIFYNNLYAFQPPAAPQTPAPVIVQPPPLIIPAVPAQAPEAPAVPPAVLAQVPAKPEMPSMPPSAVPVQTPEIPAVPAAVSAQVPIQPQMSFTPPPAAPVQTPEAPAGAPALTEQVKEGAQLLAEKTLNVKRPGSLKNRAQKTIKFRYDNEDLVEIIHFLSTKKGVNIMLPQGANAISQKVTLHLPEKVSLDDAWQLLYTLLDVAGYTMEPKGNMYVITKNGPNTSKDPLPLYIGMSPDKLPDTDQRIRYLYYLTNIKVSDDANAEMNTILTNLLPTASSTFKVDTSTNGVIISGKSNDIRAAMKIVVDLDKVDFQEKLETINLRFTVAKSVADLFNEKILKTTEVNKYHLNAKQQTEVSFFSKHTRIISIDRTNTLLLLGRPQAIERVKDFILNNIDVELEEGRSVLHIYQLQYSDASSLAGVLNAIIASTQQGGTGQSTIGSASTGIVKSFDEVIITADTPTGEDKKYYGGNKLVIACRNDDWKVIEKLIAELDSPQPQVFLEILIADLTLDDSRILGSILRDPCKIPLPGTTQFQAGNNGNANTSSDPIILSTNYNNIVPPTAPPPAPLPTSVTVPTTLQADLLRLAYDSTGAPATAYSDTNISVASLLTQATLSGTPIGGAPGSTLVSFNDSDGKTWNLLQILRQFDNTKILSHPHVLAANGQKATVKIGQQRLLTDEAVGSGGTTTTIKQKKIDADLKVEITPRISRANTVHLEINIEITDFTNTSENASRITRTVKTNALVKDQDVLSLGGLIKITTAQSVNQTPILSRIPILGWLFKTRTNEVTKGNLTVFISPTIIQPSLRKGIPDYTKDYVKLAKGYVHEGELFDSLQDPITRWFFKTEADSDAGDMMNDFMARDEFLARHKQKDREITRKKKLEKLSKPKVAHVEKKKNERSAQQIKEMVAHDENPLTVSL